MILKSQLPHNTVNVLFNEQQVDGFVRELTCWEHLLNAFCETQWLTTPFRRYPIPASRILIKRVFNWKPAGPDYFFNEMIKQPGLVPWAFEFPYHHPAMLHTAAPYRAPSFRSFRFSGSPA